MRGSFNRGKVSSKSHEPEIKPPFHALPTAREILEASGVEVHFLVGGYEPAEVALDANTINDLADIAEKRLFASD
jgi:hypothetical protein